jgi:hypothetical protein
MISESFGLRNSPSSLPTRPRPVASRGARLPDARRRIASPRPARAIDLGEDLDLRGDLVEARLAHALCKHVLAR